MKNKIYEDLSLIRSRAKLTFVFIEILLIVIILFFWKIQILDHKKYWEKSESNRIREIVQLPRRGLILDRKNRIIAKNKASFKVSIIRENSNEIKDSYQKISSILDLDVEEIGRRVNKYKSMPDFLPIVIKDDLTKKEVSIFESRKIEFPEFVIQSEPKRDYPNKICASHVVGYLQEISLEEIKNGKYLRKRIGELVGKTGIEKECESILAGKAGLVREVVDSLGRRKGEISRIAPKKGRDINLTIDLSLQKKAEKLLQGKEGAIVALKAKTGEVLVLASYPSFDPNKFINRFSPEEWIELVNSQEYPLQNRAIRGLYSPGSIFKLVMAVGALDSNIVNDHTSYFCRGSIIIYGHLFSCWFKPGHGSVDLYNGIKRSCNVYFYQVGKKMGIEKISHYAKILGLGEKTGIDLSGEKGGLVPDPEWKRETRNLPWYPGETISVAIGQGPLQVTPLQIAVQTALIANRGKKVRPYLLLDKTKELSFLSVDIKAENFEKVILGMWMAVDEKGGTAIAARVSEFEVCGKTGSAQVISKETAKKLAETNKIEIKTHSWFSGFAPRNDPEIVVTVIVEHGGGGAVTAAPIAREIFKLYRENYAK